MNPLHRTRISVVALALLLAGCGSSSELDRRAVAGRVTVNGKPMANGHVLFTPVEGTIGPAGSAMIANGEFALDEQLGLVPGHYRVEIQARPDIDFELDDDVAFAQRARSSRQRSLIDATIPPQFNTASTLTAVVQPDAEVSSFNFALDFQPQQRLAQR